MEVMICVPKGTNIKVLEQEYPDICKDEGYDDHDRYFVGESSDEDIEPSERDWLDYDEAVALCGFVEGAIRDSETLVEGNGGWAQGMMSRKDFSSLAISAEQKRELKKTSNLFWKNFRRGQKTRQCKAKE